MVQLLHMEVYSVTDVVATNLDRLEGYKVGQEDRIITTKLIHLLVKQVYIYNHMLSQW
jgi:gamma-glutamylcyclotransferase (GGCT)/AIG2-like uncharacterized protein YtfP